MRRSPISSRRSVRGIRTLSIKADLERAEADRVVVEKELTITRQANNDVAATIPSVVDRYRDLIAGLETTLQHDVPCARDQIKALIGGGEIQLVPTDDGY